MNDVISMTFINQVKERLTKNLKYKAQKVIIDSIKVGSGVTVCSAFLFIFCLGVSQSEWIKISTSPFLIMMILLSICSLGGLIVVGCFTLSQLINLKTVGQIKAFEDESYNEIYKVLSDIYIEGELKDLNEEDVQFLLSLNLNETQLSYIKKAIKIKCRLTYDDLIELNTLSKNAEKVKNEESLKTFASRYNLKKEHILNLETETETEIENYGKYL